MDNKSDIEPLVTCILDACYEVHRHLKAGYAESVYHKALKHELGLRGLDTTYKDALQVSYKGINVGNYEPDLIVEDEVIIELKSVPHISDVHCIQLVNYLTITGIDHGLVVNFGADKFEARRRYRKYTPKNTVH